MNSFLFHGLVLPALLDWATIGSMIIGAPILLIAMMVDTLSGPFLRGR